MIGRPPYPENNHLWRLPLRCCGCNLIVSRIRPSSQRSSCLSSSHEAMPEDEKCTHQFMRFRTRSPIGHFLSHIGKLSQLRNSLDLQDLAWTVGGPQATHQIKNFRVAASATTKVWGKETPEKTSESMALNPASQTPAIQSIASISTSPYDLRQFPTPTLLCLYGKPRRHGRLFPSIQTWKKSTKKYTRTCEVGESRILKHATLDTIRKIYVLDWTKSIS